MMETELDSLKQAAARRGPRAGRAAKPDWNIAMSIGVNADAQRIYHALTVPEYLEAWICIPDQPPGSQLVAREHANGYRLDHSSAGRIVASIHGSYLFRHRRKMRLFWRTIRGPACAESLVDFRLRGNFGSSILELRQTVLTSAEDHLWHRRLWQGSLQTLASLLRFA